VTTKREIKAKDIIASIRSGLSDKELMEKYKLTPKGLQSVFRKLLAHGLLDRAKFYERLSEGMSPIDNVIVRKLDRKEILMPLRILDTNDRKCSGIVTDITIQGAGVRGIVAKVGDIRRLKVLADEYFQVGSFVFKAECRWTKPGDRREGDLAGFQITDIAEEEKARLQNLIDAVEYMFPSHE
jgi:hypothetical protein